MRRIKNRNDTRTTTIATTGTVANEVARIGGDVKYVAGELGKDVKAGGDLVNRLTAGIPHNKYVSGVTDKIGQGIESIENISPKKYLYISSVGYFASSTSQYIFNGDIDHSKSLKVGLMTPYLTLTSPATGMMVGAADTAISTKIEGKENYLKEQEKYLKSSAISEIINSNPYLQKHPLGDVIKVINSEMINEVVDDGGNK